MVSILLLIGIVLLMCVILHRYSQKLPIPSLIIFLALGMLFGENGIFKISFNNYDISETICSIALIFIIFYGGFGINLKQAKKIILPASIFASLGVILTSFILALFITFFLKIDFLYALLLACVVASTDAASVFSVLKSQKLSLKNNCDSLLEMESGSNDPISYLLTVVICAMLNGNQVSIISLLLSQILIGIIAGIGLGLIAKYLINNINSTLEQGETIILVAIVLLSYAIPTLLNGNGYLSAYLCGIVVGNNRLKDKKAKVHFFDTLTGISQMIIFFLLGLLVTPSHLPNVFFISLGIMLFLTLIARPLSVLLLSIPFKFSLKQNSVIAWAGFRGVASIVFAIYVMNQNIALPYDIFNIIFVIVLLSITIQGSSLAFVAKKNDMIDTNRKIEWTFNDYQADSNVRFVKSHIHKQHAWVNKKIKDIELVNDLLIAFIIKQQHALVVPNGDTIIEANDLLVIAANEFETYEEVSLSENYISKNHKWVNQTLFNIQLPANTLVIAIHRGDDTIIPKGDTLVLANDTLIIAKY